MFNCAYTAMDDYRAFSEIMFLLLGGSGVGFSVQARHISQLPPVQHPRGERRYVVQDNIIGWSEAVRTLMKAYFFGRPKPRYIFDDIREKGMRLITSGGKAPGPIPLKECLYAIENILGAKRSGERLTSIEVFDITTHIAEAVLAGGIRRSATIALFDPWDYGMLTCKSGDWYIHSPNRAMANVSAVLDRRTTTKGEFEKVFSMCQASGSGEPGFVWTNDPDMGVNPCAEISLSSQGFCNLTEVYVGDSPSHEELVKRVTGASFLGTLQASYTDFFYLRAEWRRNAERDALLGVSLTGIASLPKKHKLDFMVLGQHAKHENKFWADKIGINPAKRVTCVKPSGTTSLVMGTSSGIHAWYAPHYLRRLRMNKEEAMYKYLVSKIPELIEDDCARPHDTAILGVPIKAPEDSQFRSESALDTLNRVKDFSLSWIEGGHIEGVNKHNVSCTINVKPEEWKDVQKWMWNNRETYTGISLLPYDNGSYVQPPFEEITEGEYNRLLPYLKAIDLSSVEEFEDNTDLAGELACSGGACEIQ